jgi:hypothetical protein
MDAATINAAYKEAAKITGHGGIVPILVKEIIRDAVKNAQMLQYFAFSAKAYLKHIHSVEI